MNKHQGRLCTVYQIEVNSPFVNPGSMGEAATQVTQKKMIGAV